MNADIGQRSTSSTVIRSTVAWAVFVVALLGILVPQGFAQQWTDAYPGIRYMSDTRPGPVEVRAVEVDLCAAGVSFRATKDSEKSRTTSSFGSMVGAQVAINGDFYTWSPSLTTIGMAMGDGELWSNDTPDWGFVAFGDENVEISPPGVHVPNPPGWMEDVVGGNIMVLQDGVVTGDTGTFCTDRHPRTVAGLSEDGTTLYLAVADGRSQASIGMTCAELGQFMDELGARDALNLDGGGSTTMWREGVGVVNSPSGGSERSVANHLAVHAAGSGPAVSCPHIDWDIEIDTNFIDLDVIHTDGDGDEHEDVFPGDEFQGEILLSNQSSHVIRDVWAGYWFEHPYVKGVDYTIYTDHPVYDQQTWVVNDSNDAPENPEPGQLGQDGALNLYAFSPGETKRIVFEMEATQYSIGMADHPDLRAWVRNIEDIYGVQQSFWDDPDAINEVGVTLRAFSELDVISRDHWHFAGPHDDHFEGWRRCTDGVAQMSIDTGTESLVLAAGDESRCLSSPDWTRIDADTFDELVIELSNGDWVSELTVEWEGTDAGAGSKTFQSPSLQQQEAVAFPLGADASWTGQIDRIRLTAPGGEALRLGAVYFHSTSDANSTSPYATDGPVAVASTGGDNGGQGSDDDNGEQGEEDPNGSGEDSDDDGSTNGDDDHGSDGGDGDQEDPNGSGEDSDDGASINGDDDPGSGVEEGLDLDGDDEGGEANTRSGCTATGSGAPASMLLFVVFGMALVNRRS